MEPQAATFRDELRVVFLRNITIEGVDTFLKHHLFKAAIRPRVEFGGYGTMTQDVLAPDGPVARVDPDLIVLAIDPEESDPSFGSPGWTAENLRADLGALFDLLATGTRATIVLHTFVRPSTPSRGWSLIRARQI